MWGVPVRKQQTVSFMLQLHVIMLHRLQSLFKGLHEPFRQPVSGWVVRCQREVLYSVFFIKILNSSATIWGPLSVQTCSGSPFRANMVRRTAIVLTVIVDDIWMASGHFEWEFMASKNIEPRNGPAKSTWTLCHGEEGHSHG